MNNFLSLSNWNQGVLPCPSDAETWRIWLIAISITPLPLGLWMEWVHMIRVNWLFWLKNKSGYFSVLMGMVKNKTLEHLVFVVLPIMWLWCLKSSQMWRMNHAMKGGGGSWKPSDMRQYPMLEFHFGLELPCDLHIQTVKWCGAYKHVLSLRPRAFPEIFTLALKTPAWPKSIIPLWQQHQWARRSPFGN